MYLIGIKYIFLFSWYNKKGISLSKLSIKKFDFYYTIRKVVLPNMHVCFVNGTVNEN